MELFDPTSIDLDGVTTAMRADLLDQARRVNHIRPLDPELLRQVKDQLFGERIFSSNAIEGNTLTVRETRLILQTKTFLDASRKREAQEALNLGDAATKLEQLAELDDAWHDVAQFLRIHQMLMNGINDRIAGVLRISDVMIRGRRRQPPDSHRFPLWSIKHSPS